MNSALNPEAPEFYPNLKSVTQEGYTTVHKTIRASNHLPSGNSYHLFKTVTDFNIVACRLSENVVVQSNHILVTELPAEKLKCNDHEANMEKIIDANDSMLDRVNINIDTESGVNKPSDKFFKRLLPNVNVSPWNRTASPVIAKIQMGSTTFIGAKNIPRPQLTFKDAIDNSENLWVPKISDKPNNIKPLALNILYNDNGEAVGYEHPYEVELDLYQPPADMISNDHGPPKFPAPIEDTKLTYVETEMKLDDLITHLTTVTELAVDVEHHSYRSYQGITCLIQISTDEGGDFIIDTLRLREHIHKLSLIFTDPKKIKVFHGAEWDVLWLQRDFGLYIVGLFDTHQAARALQVNRLSLKYLLIKYCQVDADKKYQLADWRMRPLPAELLHYARMDTHYLLYIWRRMRAELLEAGAGQPHVLFSVFEQSRQICRTTYNKQVIDDNSHMSLYVKSQKAFNSRQMAALQILYKWRDAQARILDESTMYLLPNHMLLALSEILPREVQGVHACCSPMPPFVKQNIIILHRMLLSCRELPLEPQLYRMPTSVRTMVNVLQPHQYVHDFTQHPEFRDDECINLDSANVVMEDYNNFQPDVTVFVPVYDSKKCLISDLNAEAKLFIPPYDRYRKYRSLAQLEELKEFKEKEAKITAIGKGDELIKSEVLIKIRQAKTKVEKEETEVIPSSEPIKIAFKVDEVNNKTEKRKRKMSTEKADRKDAITEVTQTKNNNTKNYKNNVNKNVKTFQYNNVNYKKFFDDSDKGHKQPKMKFKKHK